MPGRIGLLAAILIALSSCASKAQQSPGAAALQTLTTGTNWIGCGYGIYDTGTKSFGGGVAMAYKLSDFALPVVRLDYIHQNIFMPSATIQLQLPFDLWGFRVTPLTFTGIATPLSGKDAINGSPIGMIGAGVSVSKGRFGLVADVENWSKFSGLQFRLGAWFSF
jgi:hypothetical protein